MRRVFVHERLGWITSKEFRDNEQPDIFLAVEGFLKNMATITVHCEFDDATANNKKGSEKYYRM
jgi:hypothetical protein